MSDSTRGKPNERENNYLKPNFVRYIAEHLTSNPEADGQQEPTVGATHVS